MERLLLLITCVACAPLSRPALAQSEAAVRAGFEQNLQIIMEAITANRLQEISKLGGGWARLLYEVSGPYEYDVEKTESLVSPYTAVAEFPYRRYWTAFYETEAEAAVDTLFPNVRTERRRVRFAFQRGTWVVQSVELSVPDNPALSGWYDVSDDDVYRLVFQEWMRGMPPLTGNN